MTNGIYLFVYRHCLFHEKKWNNWLNGIKTVLQKSKYRFLMKCFKMWLNSDWKKLREIIFFHRLQCFICSPRKICRIPFNAWPSQWSFSHEKFLPFLVCILLKSNKIIRIHNQLLSWFNHQLHQMLSFIVLVDSFGTIEALMEQTHCPHSITVSVQIFFIVKNKIKNGTE